MGFGVALIGYAFLLLQDIGGGLFAALTMGYGFFLASRLNDNFLRASVSALFMLPRGVVQLCSLFGLFVLEDLPVLNTVTYLLHIGAWMLSSYFWLTAVIQIARDNGATKLENKARNRLVLTVTFLCFSAAVPLLNLNGVLGNLAFSVAALQYILQYAVIFINFFFLHTCFILITGERQYERDKQEIAKERAKRLEKQQAEQREVSKRIGKRK
ncbi:MAG: hypothetical protein E7586_03585 [Ruminococcaceae bacterium]|nr:hypothetical protein [Oscillospiraceae bacterium]